MNTKRFVTGSSVILAGWLGATFLNEVPSQRYPKLDKKTADSEAETHPDEVMSTPPRDLPVTVLR
ncbi:MAG: hypothetical protein WED15_09195 [Akkermansiaceae bacterium]